MTVPILSCTRFGIGCESHLVDSLGLWGCCYWGNNLHKHLVSQSDELRCRNASNEAIFHAIQVLSKSLGCEDQWGEEVRYLARQTKEALMYILACIIVTEVYRGYLATNFNWFEEVKRLW